MKYVLQATDFVTPVYFCDHPGHGFRLSTSRADAKILTSLSDTRQEADRLREESGMNIAITTHPSDRD